MAITPGPRRALQVLVGGPDASGPDPAREALLRVARVAAAGAAMDDVVAVVAREAAATVGADGGAVWRLGPGPAQLVGAFGEDSGAADGGAVALLARTRLPAQAVRPGLGGVRWEVAVPLSVDGTLWGAVLASGRAEAPAPHDAEELLLAFATVAALAVGAAKAREDLATSATTDPLTRSLTQDEFQRRLDVAVGMAIDTGAPLSLAIFDIDNLRRINGTFGHRVGDRVLRAVADSISAELASEDVLARVGGQEFAVILAGLPVVVATAVADRVRAAVARMQEPGLPAVTLSGGVADLEDACTSDDLFAVADGALRAAKRAGRDRVLTPAQATVAGQPAGEGEAGAAAEADAGRAVRALAEAISAREPELRLRGERAADLVARMAAAGGWSGPEIAGLRDAALLHELGMISLPDDVLRAGGTLSRAQYELVVDHAAVGARIVAEVLSPEQVAAVRHHHERWDGCGYPDGLAGEAIPLAARLLAAAGAYCAMTTRRRDRPGRSPEAALAVMRAEAGRQFCPRAVALLEAAITGHAG